MKKNIRQSMRSLLSLPVGGEDDIKDLHNVGIKSRRPYNSELIALRLFEAACRGELSALKEVVRLDSESESIADAVTIVSDIGERK